MAKETGILGYFEKGSDGQLVHRMAKELFKGTYCEIWKNNLKEFFVQLRNQLQDKKKSFYCDCCKGRLMLAGNYVDEGETLPAYHKRLHLRHRNGEQSEDCIYRHEESKSKEEINRDNHVNRQESRIHYMLKAFVKSYVETTLPECSCAIEKRIRVAGTHRTPDVNVRFERDGLLKQGSEIAIEIQVSPIMMSDIERRMEIDREGKRYILWVTDNYHGTVLNIDQLYKEDIFERCGLNMFVLDEEAVQATTETNELMLKVFYTKYHLDGDVLAEPELVSEIVRFVDLKFDNVKYRVYYYPSETERQTCVDKAEALRREREQKAIIEAKIAEESRAKEQKLREDKRLYDNFISAITYYMSWDGDIQEVIRIIKTDCRAKFGSFIDALSQKKIYGSSNWNLLADCLTVFIEVYQAYLDTYEDYSFEGEKTIIELIEWIRYHLTYSTVVDNPHQFSLGRLIELFPNTIHHSLKILSNPNYRLNEEDVRLAHKHLKDYNDNLRQGFIPDNDQKHEYAYWSAFVLADRIHKSGTSINKRDLLGLMIEKWQAVCVFLSMAQGHIVGFGYKRWVDFADYMKNNYPELVPKFFEVAQKRGYSLRSKTKDHYYILSKFIQESNAASSSEFDELYRIIFPTI